MPYGFPYHKIIHQVSLLSCVSLSPSFPTPYISSPTVTAHPAVSHCSLTLLSRHPAPTMLKLCWQQIYQHISHNLNKLFMRSVYSVCPCVSTRHHLWQIQNMVRGPQSRVSPEDVHLAVLHEGEKKPGLLFLPMLLVLPILAAFALDRR